MGVKLSVLAPYAPTTVYIRGKITFSRVKDHVQGAELEKANAKKVANNQQAITRPYTTITIKDAYIVDPDGSLDPNVRAYFENEKLYNKQQLDGSITKMYSALSKSPTAPAIVYSADAGQELAGKGIADKNVPLRAELANDLDITIAAALFNSANGIGLGMDYILINEPIRYYQGNIGSALAAHGIIYQPPVAEPTKENATPQSVSPMVNVVPAGAMAQPMQPNAYQQPAQAYQQPAQAYQQPAQTYQQPVQNDYQQAVANPSVPNQANPQQQQAAANPIYGGPQSGVTPTPLNYTPN